MSFTPKAWEDAPSKATPISADALIDGETRLSDYTAAHAATASAKEAAFGATGDGTTDDTAAVQAAIDAVNLAGGGTVYFPAGTYKVSQLSLYDNIRLLGESRRVSTLKCSGPSSAGSAFINAGSKVGVTIEHLTIDGNNEDFATYGIYVTGNGWDKLAAVRFCRIANFTTTNGAGAGHGLYCWTSQKFTVEGNEFVNNRIDVFMDSSDEDAHVVNNMCWVEGGYASKMIGIQFAGGDTSGGLIMGNFVQGVLVDPSGNGQNGHGINLVGSVGVRVIGNTVDGAVTSGIHIGDGSYGAKVAGNHIKGGGVGIYCEANFGSTSIPTDGSGVACDIDGNTIEGSGGYGISISYGPGTTARGNHISGCQSEGIICDSDRVTIVDNVLWNNYTADAAPSPNSVPDVQAHIRVTTGNKCRVSGNQVFDTTGAAVKADYAIAVGDGNHLVKDNICTGGYTTAAVDSVGTTNVLLDNVS